MTKKVLFVTTRLFWPTDSGRKVSLYHYCRGLHEIYGYDIYLYSFLEAGQKDNLVDNKPEFIADIKLAAAVGKVIKLKNLICKSLFQGEPFQTSVYFSEKNKKALEEYCNRIHPDIVMVDMIRLASYYEAFRTVNCRKILDLDDLLSKRYKRQCLSSNANAQILGAYAVNKSFISNLLKLNFLKRSILKSESKRVEKAEKKYGILYDNVIFVSQNETDYFNRLLPGKAMTIRLGVDYEFYSETCEIVKEEGALAFIGNLKVSANADSLEMIDKFILPKLNFLYKFYIIGVVPDHIKSRYSDNDKIVFCGVVEDMRPIIQKCKLFVAPIAYGSGIKTKILEAMAMGIPVVTNSIGAEGIEVTNGKHLICEDDYVKLADSINNSIGDDVKLDNLSKSARELIKKKYNWDIIFKDMVQILGN